MAYIILGTVLLVIIIFACWWISTSNNFKRTSIKISEALSGIEVALTKRFDMLTKMLDVAKGYAAHEKEVFYQTVNLRKGMSVEEMNDANNQLNKVASGIYAVAENYPELRSSEVFRELQGGIRDAEEHLQAARRLYNSVVTRYNTAIVVFPSSVIANKQGLAAQKFFEAEEYKKADVKMEF